MEHFLSILKPDGSTDRVALTGTSLTLGRVPENDISFPRDEVLSRQHMRFRKREDGWAVRDLDTRNGTRVNHDPIADERLLRPGDVIAAGRLLIRFDSEPEEHFAAELTLHQALAHPGSQSAMDLLVRACRALVNPGPRGWYDFVLSSAMDFLGADRGVLMILENEELVPRATIGSDLPISATIRDRVMRDKLSVVALDIEQDREYDQAQSLLIQGVRSLIAVPLQSEHRIHGLLYLHKTVPQGFKLEDLNTVTVLAHMAAIRREQEILAERELRTQRLADDRRRALEAAEMLRHAEARAVLAESAASMGRLAAAVSHEINTPLGALKSSVETLLRAVEKSQSTHDPSRFFAMAEDLCGSIAASAERLNAIVARLRRVTNLDRAEVLSIDLARLLDDVAQIVDASRFELDVAGLPEVISRPQVLSAVFTSILEHCRAEGARITAKPEGDAIHVRIEQAGRVFSESELLELFEPSFRAQAGKIGTDNWGLFTARHLIRELGGDLSAESMGERGVVLTVVIRYERS